jgi:hypothetical protein
LIKKAAKGAMHIATESLRKRVLEVKGAASNRSPASPATDETPPRRTAASPTIAAILLAG